MLGLRPMSGYDIKNLVDHSTRFFWAASYGQIYPELRRLAAAGLIEGTADPQGERQRTVYRLTETGATALREWLTSPPEVQETRDESLLKVFFSDFAGRDATLAALEEKIAYHREVVERLREVERTATKDPDSGTHLTLRFGIACNEYAAEFCEREARRLRAGERRRAA